MRLLSLEIGQPYKSLESFKYEFREDASGGVGVDGIDPLCFVGLNGSGKSNIIDSAAVRHLGFHSPQLGVPS